MSQSGARGRRSGYVALASLLLAGCGPHVHAELGFTFTVVNQTDQTLHISGRPQQPGAALPGAANYDDDTNVAAHQHGGLRLNLSAGACINETVLAYGLGGRLVAQQPTPLCEKPDGTGSTWTISSTR
jgi:hypothetical protein